MDDGIEDGFVFGFHLLFKAINFLAILLYF